MKLLIINGPNINMLGIREPDIYGKNTYKELVSMIEKKCSELEIEAEFYQSNHEGGIVDTIQGAYGRIDGIVINPAAYTHTSVAILDALKAVGIPSVEVHISEPNDREPFRHISYAGLYCEHRIAGHGFAGYTEAVEYLCERYKR